MNYKSNVAFEDLALAEGNTGAAETFDRRTSTGGVLVFTKIDASQIKYRYSAGSIEDSATNTFLVAKYGTAKNVTTIAACVADLGTSKGRMRFSPGNWLITTNTTIPNAAEVEEGAVFVLSAGVVLTFSDDVIAGRYTIFSLGTGATVVFSKKQKVYARHFGVLGDGTETYTYFLNAAYTAKTVGSTLVLPAGTVKCTPTVAMDWTGISSVECEDGNCIIDNSTCTIAPCFKVEGSVTLIASAQTLSINGNTITVDPGTYARGDTILIVSDDKIPNTVRTYYYKGGRHHVTDYDSGTNVLTISPIIDYAYTNAYVYHISSEPNFHIGSEISFHGNIDYIYARALEIRFGIGKVDSFFKHYRNGALTFSDSAGYFTGNIRACFKEVGDNGYGVVVADLSDVRVNALILHCRHCVSGGGGSNWTIQDVGGETTDAVALPAIYTVTGGIYKGVDILNATSTALDAHGCVKSVDITSSIIFTGVSISSQFANVTGNTIFFRKRYGIHVAADNDSVSWGDYLIQNNKIKLLGTGVNLDSRSALVMDSQSYCRKLRFNDNVVDKSGGGVNADDVSFYQLAGQIADIEMIDNKFDAAPCSVAGTSIDCVINQYGYLKYRNNKHLYNRMSIIPKANNLNLDIDENVFMVSPNWGCTISGTDGYYDTINCNDNHSRRCWYGGIYIAAKVITLEATGNKSRECNQSGTVGVIGGLRIDAHNDCKNLIVSNNSGVDDQAVVTQHYNVYVTAGVGCSANLVANNNTSLNCTNGNAFIGANLVKVGQSGNRATAGTQYPDMLLDSNGGKWRIKTDGSIEAFS